MVIMLIMIIIIITTTTSSKVRIDNTYLTEITWGVPTITYVPPTTLPRDRVLILTESKTLKPLNNSSKLKSILVTNINAE